MSKNRDHWKKRQRNGKIAGAVGDPHVYERLSPTGEVLATVTLRAHGWDVALPTGETAGPYGAIEVAKQSAVERIAINRRDLNARN